MDLPNSRSRRALQIARDSGYDGELEQKLGTGRHTLGVLVNQAWLELRTDQLGRSRYSITDLGSAALDAGLDATLKRRLLEGAEGFREVRKDRKKK